MVPLTKRDRAGASPTGAARFEPVAGAIVADKYRIERTLGEGGMGIVVAATHLALEQRVAIKFLHADSLRNQVAVERFLREGRVAARVRSEHVARVHDVGTLSGGIPYIVMEYLEGQDLGDIIAQSGALAVDATCEMVLQACEALAEVHAAGIVHRDLKPSNLFVSRRADGSPVVKLLDFGISKLTVGPDESGVDPALTATATIMGSPSYMSPEQLKSTKEVDPRSDVWSLGTVLYEALTGRPAFRGESVPQVCAMIASEDPALPSSLRDGMPTRLERAIVDCLEKDPDRRISLSKLSEVLAEFAPERAKPLLERVQAIVGARAAPPSGRVVAKGELPVLQLATVARSSTSAARNTKGRGARVWVWASLIGVAVLVAWAVVTGRVRAPQLGAGSASSAQASAGSRGGVGQVAAGPSVDETPHQEPVSSVDPAASSWPDGLRTEDAASSHGAADRAAADNGPTAGPSIADSEEADDEGDPSAPSEDGGASHGASATPARASPTKSRPARPHHAAKPGHRHH